MLPGGQLVFTSVQPPALVPVPTLLQSEFQECLESGRCADSLAVWVCKWSSGFQLQTTCGWTPSSFLRGSASSVVN